MDETPPLAEDSEARPGRAFRRYALIAAPLLAAVAAFFLLFWPRIEVGLWINGLHSDEPASRREMRTHLIEAARGDPAVVQQIADAIGDEDRGFHVRQTLVGILTELNRMKVVLDAYAQGGMAARAPILARMQREREFKEYWAEDPALSVRDTVRRWLETNTGKLAGERSHAVQIAMQLDMRETLPSIRPLLARDGSRVHENKQRDLLIAAAAAVTKFEDCESIPKVAALAKDDPNLLVRVRALQDVERAGFVDGAACAGAVSEAEMRALVVHALADEAKEVRMAAMLILEKHPAWTADALPRLREILAGKMPEGLEGTERRHALQALVAARDPELLEALPRYFFDPNPSVRSSCARLAMTFHPSGPRLEGCLVGLVRNEVESRAVFTAALDGLRQVAGTWHGLSRALMKKRGGERKERNSFFETIFTAGAAEGVTRDAMVEAWFRWLCGDLGLDEARTQQMVTAYTAFWEAADRKDAEGALAALKTLPSAPAGLFRYEQAWLALQG